MGRIGVNWITDRRPSEADADSDGEVFSRADGYQKWHQVEHGQTWCHSYYWRPPSAPEPQPEPKQLQQVNPLRDLISAPPPCLRVGQAWRTRCGSIATIVSVSHVGDNECPIRACIDGITSPMSSGSGLAYFRNGKCRGLPEFDLVYLPRRIVSIARTVHKHGHTLDAVADDGTAWWMIPGECDWTQLPALPDVEAGS